MVCKNRGGSYVLKDELGNLKASNYLPNRLKLISQDEVVPCNELYEVNAIVAHREVESGGYKYKVRWLSYEEKDNTWQTAESFTQPKPIHDYWKRLGKQPDKSTNNAHSSSKCKTLETQTTESLRRSKRSRK